MNTEFRSLCGVRLRLERERLELSQAEMAALAETKPRTYQDWERGVATVSAEFLSVVANHGVDVLFVLTGERASERQGLDPLRRAVLHSFDSCTPEKQIEAVQYMALLAAGVAPSQSGETAKTVTKAKVSKSILGMAVGVVGKKDV